MKNAVLVLLLAALAALLVLRWREEPVPQTPPPSAPSKLRQLLEQAGQDPGLRGAAIGFCLLDARGQVVEELNSETAFIPASTLKTLTTATALEKWGPDHRLETVLAATAPIRDDGLTGDVIIRGAGDPMLALGDLEAWAQQLAGEKG